MNAVKKCLFGGALVGAGLCSTASAEAVNWSYGSGYAGIDSGISSSDGGVGSWDTDAVDGSSSSYARSTGGTFGMDLAANDPSFAFARGSGNLSVAYEATFTFAWDADILYITIENEFDGLVHYLFESNTSGSFEHTFNANEEYTIYVAMWDFGHSAAAATFTMDESTVSVVPLPPAAFAGLGMLAGLGAYRRLRR